jgi:RNA polymerase sigma-70 factor, ECF subfamily
MDSGHCFDSAVDLAREGDGSGFHMLWISLQSHLCRYLKGLGCVDAEDVASETWLQAIRDFKRFTGTGDDFRAWLFTIGRHRAIDEARSRIRFQDKMPGLVPVEIRDWDPVEDEVLYRLSQQRAAALLAALSKDQAAVVQLRVIAGLDTDSTAGMLGKSRNAVRSCLHRGLHRLSADPRVQVLMSAPLTTSETVRRQPGPLTTRSELGAARLE